MVVLGAVALVGTGCADNEPPDYLTELGGETTTAAPTSTTIPQETSSTLAGTIGSTTTTALPTPVTDLAVGDCVAGAPFSGDTSAEATEAALADCTAQHDGEVVGLVTYTQGPNADYPGQDQVASFAEGGCATAFEGYVGAAYGSSDLKMLSLWPTEDSWSSGDREAVCVAFQDSAPLTASVAGTG